jgi:hypothetical protein
VPAVLLDGAKIELIRARMHARPGEFFFRGKGFGGPSLKRARPPIAIQGGKDTSRRSQRPALWARRLIVRGQVRGQRLLLDPVYPIWKASVRGHAGGPTVEAAAVKGSRLRASAPRGDPASMSPTWPRSHNVVEWRQRPGAGWQRDVSATPLLPRRNIKRDARS